MRPVALVTAAVALAVLAASPGFAQAGTGGTVSDRGGGSFDVADDEGFVSFSLEGTDSLTIYDFRVSDGGEAPAYRRVFESIEVSSFSRNDAPRFEGEVAVIRGGFGTLEVHGSPMASLDLRTIVQNDVFLRPVSDVGVIPRGEMALIGTGSLTAEVVIQGDGSVAKAGDLLSVSLAPNARLHFRRAFLGNELGEHIRSGVLAAEAYVSSDSGGATMDVVYYQPASLVLDSSSVSRKAFTISGDLTGERVVVLSLAREGFRVSSSDLAVSLDGEAVSRVDTIGDLMGPGGAAFASFESDQILQVLVRVPEFSTHVLVLQGAGPAAVEYVLPLALGAAVALTVVAAAYLFRPED